MLLFLSEFFGHFHPVVVHLPIGILLIGALFHTLGRTERYRTLRPAVMPLLLIGMITAVLACITGWLLYGTGQYDGSIAERHQWLGILTAGVALLCYIAEKRNFKYLSGLILVLVIAVSVTGHLGGTLTHGDGYLTAAFSSESDNDEIKPIANVQDAILYEDVIRPLLAARCNDCHGNRKQKGGLRLDSRDFILKGGEDGVVIVPADVERSELVYRVFLAHEDDDHMPPKEKPQLTAAQKDLIKWWVASGASFDKKVHELNPPVEVTNLLASLGTEERNSAKSVSIPATPVDPGPQKVIDKLRNHGVVIYAVAQNSNYLSANIVNADPANDSIMPMLSSLKKQIVWLRTGAYPIGENELATIGEMKSLTRLHINKFANGQPVIDRLGKLEQLTYLNLSGIEVNAGSMASFKNLRSLKNLYLFQCVVPAAEYTHLKKYLPQTKIDTGGYRVATLASDTVRVE